MRYDVAVNTGCNRLGWIVQVEVGRDTARLARRSNARYDVAADAGCSGQDGSEDIRREIHFE